MKSNQLFVINRKFIPVLNHLIVQVFPVFAEQKELKACLIYRQSNQLSGTTLLQISSRRNSLSMSRCLGGFRTHRPRRIPGSLQNLSWRLRQQPTASASSAGKTLSEWRSRKTCWGSVNPSMRRTSHWEDVPPQGKTPRLRSWSLSPSCMDVTASCMWGTQSFYNYWGHIQFCFVRLKTSVNLVTRRSTVSRSHPAQLLLCFFWLNHYHWCLLYQGGTCCCTPCLSLSM